MVADISRGVFQSQLKSFPFSQSLSFHSHLSLAWADLLKIDHSVFDSHWQIKPDRLALGAL